MSAERISATPWWQRFFIIIFLLDIFSLAWQKYCIISMKDQNSMLRKHAEKGLFYFGYYYWYFGQVCPGLVRRSWKE